MTPKAIVIHCSASEFGDAATINAWHKANGWSKIGYHRVIPNGFLTLADARTGRYRRELDGKIEVGRDDRVIGAHCIAGGMNEIALGVCCIGNPGWMPDGPEYLTAGPRSRVAMLPYLTTRQHAALIDALARLCLRYEIDSRGTVQHRGRTVHTLSQHSDHDGGKPLCASLNMHIVRSQVAARLAELR